MSRNSEIIDIYVELRKLQDDKLFHALHLEKTPTEYSETDDKNYDTYSEIVELTNRLYDLAYEKYEGGEE